MFAAIVSRAIKSLSLWRLQEGERIGLLDHLIGCTTITNTVTTQFGLGQIRLVGILLIVLWALSPIGGQASLRVITFETAPVGSSTTLQYMEMNSSYVPYMAADTGSQLSPVDALFLSALAAPPSIKASSSDNWGNLKIPMLETLPGDQAGGWLTVRGDQQNPIVYSSLLGIPVANIPSRGNSAFSIETSYWILNCPTLAKVTSQQEMLNLLNVTSSNGVPSIPPWFGTWGGINSTSTPMLLPSGQYRCNGTDPQMPPRTIQYVSFDNPGKTLDNVGTLALCTIETSYVELSVFCEALDCVVNQMRRSILPHQPAAYTGLDSCNGLGTIPACDWFTSYFAGIITGTHADDPTAIQAYFVNSGNPFNLSEIFTLPPIWSVGNHLFAIRFAQLLNTYWIASVGTEAIVLGHPPNYTDLSFLSVNTTLFSNTTASVNVDQEILVCHWGWLAALVVATAAMFLAAAAKLFIDLQIWIPELSMNVSTLTRGNRFLGHPPGGSILSDYERSRLLKDVRVRFGDVANQEPVGHLAIGDEKRVARFQERRYYF
jgi:hypothetical protein